MFVEVAVTVFGECVPCHRLAIAKLLAGVEESLILEFAQLGAKVAIGLFHQLLQATEGKFIVSGEKDANPQPCTMSEELTQVLEALPYIVIPFRWTVRHSGDLLEKRQ